MSTPCTWTRYVAYKIGVRYPGPEAMYEYDLFAVINHEGQIDNGHYTNYARFQDEVCVWLCPVTYLALNRLLRIVVSL